MKKLLSFFIAFAVISSMFCVFSLTSFAYEPNSADIYYGRSALKTMPNSEALIYAYDRLEEGIERSEDVISVYNGSDPISTDEIQLVMDVYRRDHTEHFWLGGTYSMSYTEETTLAVKPSYILSGDALVSARAKFDNSVNNILSHISPEMSDFEKELILHDRIAAIASYDESAQNAHNAYGALVDGKTVCEGYAEALQVLLHRAGIQSFIMLGEGINPSNGSSENHAWNAVLIDGKYYHTDLTWNDQERHLYHAYFNIPDTEILKDHSIWETDYPLPVCDSRDADYFILRGIVLTDYTAESIATLLKENDFFVSMYIPNGAEEFLQWYKDNIADIAQAAGVTGRFSYKRMTLGNEVVIGIDTCLHSTLSRVSANSPNCENGGNIAYYTCECGKWFEDKDHSVEIRDRSFVELDPLGHLWTLKNISSDTLKEKADSCVEFDTYWHTCERCGKISDTEFFDSETSGDHLAGPAATENSPQLCTLCGYELAPKLHTHSPTKIKKSEPSCTENGKEAYYHCSCGKYFSDLEAQNEITDLEKYGIIPALGHSFEANETSCSRCGYSTGNSSAPDTGGCMSSLSTVPTAVFLGAAAAVLLRKKKSTISK